MPRPKGQGARAMLREMILSGQFKPGVYLPPVRKLAAEMDVPKSTVYDILTLLQNEGLVQIQPGRRGVMVANAVNPEKTLSRIFFRPSDYGTFGGTPENVKFLEALCREAEKRNVEVIFSFSDSLNCINEISDLYRKNIIQAVLYMECANSDLVKPLEAANIPYAIMNDEQVNLDCVKCVQDFRGVARKAASYLIERGHRQLGLIRGDLKSHFYTEMEAGFRGSLADEGLEYKPDWFVCTGLYSGANRDRNVREIAKILKRKNRPSAFFTIRDYRARMLYEACDLAGLKIPDDVSVISYDDINWPVAASVGLSTFREPVSELVESSMEILKEWVLSGKKPKNREVQCQLIERSSVQRI